MFQRDPRVTTAAINYNQTRHALNNCKTLAVLTTATPTFQVSNKEFIFVITKNKLMFRPFSNPDSDELVRAIEKAETLYMAFEQGLYP